MPIPAARADTPTSAASISPRQRKPARCRSSSPAAGAAASAVIFVNMTAKIARPRPNDLAAEKPRRLIATAAHSSRATASSAGPSVESALRMPLTEGSSTISAAAASAIILSANNAQPRRYATHASARPTPSAAMRPKSRRECVLLTGSSSCASPCARYTPLPRISPLPAGNRSALRSHPAALLMPSPHKSSPRVPSAVSSASEKRGAGSPKSSASSRARSSERAK